MLFNLVVLILTFKSCLGHISKTVKEKIVERCEKLIPERAIGWRCK